MLYVNAFCYFQPEKFISSKLKPFKKPLPFNTNAADNKPTRERTYPNVQHISYSDWIPLEIDPVSQKSQIQLEHRKPNNIPNNDAPITTYSDSTNYPALQYEPASIYPIAFIRDGDNNFHSLQYLMNNNENIKQNAIDLTHLSVVPRLEPIEQVDVNKMIAPKLKNNDDRLKNHRLTDYEFIEDDTDEKSKDMMLAENKSVEKSNEKQHSKRERRNRPRGGSKESENVHRHGRSRTNDKDRKRHN